MKQLLEQSAVVLLCGAQKHVTACISGTINTQYISTD